MESLSQVQPLPLRQLDEAGVESGDAVRSVEPAASASAAAGQLTAEEMEAVRGNGMAGNIGRYAGNINRYASYVGGVAATAAFVLAAASVAPVAVGFLSFVSMGAAGTSAIATVVQWRRGEISRADAVLSIAVNTRGIAFGVAARSVTSLTRASGGQALSFIRARTLSVAGALASSTGRR